MLIPITCPQCGEKHELPDSFAGGVYRCTKCHTLMSVSADAKRAERAENLANPVIIRTDEERIAIDISSHSGRSASRAGLSRAGRSASRSRPIQGRSRSGRFEPTATESNRATPPPSKSTASRWLVIGAIAAILVILAVIVVIVKSGSQRVASLDQTPKIDAQRPPAEVKTVLSAKRPLEPATATPDNWIFAYDPTLAPLAIRAPNILGLPLGHRTHLVLDGRLNGAQRTQVEALLTQTLAGQPSAAMFSASWAGNPTKTIDLLPLKDRDASAFQAFFTGNTSTTSPDWRQAMREATGQSTGAPDTVIVLLAGSLSDIAAEQILNRLTGEGRRPVLHLACLTAGVPTELRQYAKTSKGQCLQIEPAQLEQWTAALHLVMPAPTRWQVSASSEQPTGKAEQAIDGDPQTHWHSRYSPELASPPHAISIDLGQVTSLSQIKIWPRASGPNGIPRRLRIETSLDGASWTVACERDAWKADSPSLHQPQEFRLDPPVSARHVRLTGLGEINEGPWMTIAEIEVNGQGKPQ